ncbi:MAG: Uncharacterised protein [Polaribacter sp. SA4-10]|nr:MAG: Uncharacterised protein [Polaribacter sp. SA4-10]
MKSIIPLIMIPLFFISCNNNETINNEITLDKAEIRSFLKKRNPNYSFPKESENNFSRNLKPELEPLYLNNLKELEEFLDKIDAMKSENYSRTSITHVPLENGGNGNNPGRYKITRSRGFWVYHNTIFYVDEPCVGSGINSYTSGYSLGLSYSHISGTITTNYSNISYTLTGMYSYSVFINGIGTYWNEEVYYTGTHDCPNL